MPDEIEIVTIDGHGAMPEIELIVGQAQFGKYQIHLWDRTGHNPVSIGEGINTDTVPDKFSIGGLAGLDQRILNWDVIVAAFNGGPGQLYSVIVKITQNNTVVENGEFHYTGQLDGAAIISDIVRLAIQ